MAASEGDDAAEAADWTTMLDRRRGDSIAAFDFRFDAIANLAKRLRLLTGVLKPPGSSSKLTYASFCPALSVITKAASMSSTDQGGQEAVCQRCPPHSDSTSYCGFADAFGILTLRHVAS